ncbi:hypothetical protein I588_03535 [Enterococcus pallens ATCC BAA-351]|uniref:Phage protein n=1 Tax=Enterococcus pallens ATCC BAA-351 TaxID=1158607 RepID=R2SEX7_9ENTE|nr:hypothetical protein [Enterococcus pallens]EOH86744.1 hypothetical protein UAU_05190 [Enterococcus pallens ATCC BAA-351]EOU18540.1 hypothetical protein I588_03535 [Enterococcus pallens ATCC BAA-351]OJG71173.1 hypothetical protein RV10_GL005085 [Enterococcus pallens]
MVKVGIRKPSIKKSVKARTTGKVKRKVKSSVNPVYGKKGAGWVNNPKKAAYNKAYSKTTKSVTSFGSSSNRKNASKSHYSNGKRYEGEQKSGCGCWTLLVAALVLPILAPFFPIAAGIALLIIVIVSLIRLGTKRNTKTDFGNQENELSDIESEEDNWDDF